MDFGWRWIPRLSVRRTISFEGVHEHFRTMSMKDWMAISQRWLLNSPEEDPTTRMDKGEFSLLFSWSWTGIWRWRSPSLAVLFGSFRQRTSNQTIPEAETNGVREPTALESMSTLPPLLNLASILFVRQDSFPPWRSVSSALTRWSLLMKNLSWMSIMLPTKDFTWSNEFGSHLWTVIARS